MSFYLFRKVKLFSHIVHISSTFFLKELTYMSLSHLLFLAGGGDNPEKQINGWHRCLDFLTGGGAELLLWPCLKEVTVFLVINTLCSSSSPSPTTENWNSWNSLRGNQEVRTRHLATLSVLWEMCFSNLEVAEYKKSRIWFQVAVNFNHKILPGYCANWLTSSKRVANKRTKIAFLSKIYIHTWRNGWVVWMVFQVSHKAICETQPCPKSL